MSISDEQYEVQYQPYIGWYWHRLPADGERPWEGPFRTRSEAVTDAIYTLLGEHRD